MINILIVVKLIKLIDDDEMVVAEIYITKFLIKGQA
jgi:hypothetical protein